MRIVLQCNLRNTTFCCKFPQLYSYQILLKLVNIWLSYSKNQKGELFWNKVYTLLAVIGLRFGFGHLTLNA